MPVILPQARGIAAATRRVPTHRPALQRARRRRKGNGRSSGGKGPAAASRARGHKGGSAPGHQVLPKLPPLKSVSATLLGDADRFTDDQTCGCTLSIIFNRE